MINRLPERIQLKSPDQIATMRAAGLVVARALAAMRAAVAPGVSTADLDAIARGTCCARPGRPRPSWATTATRPSSARR